jgi:hypothetical protein
VLSCCETVVAGVAASACAVRDVWNHKDLPSSSGSLAMKLGPHGSNFYTLGASAAHAAF